jgi:hypothetical protein
MRPLVVHHFHDLKMRMESGLLLCTFHPVFSLFVVVCENPERRYQTATNYDRRHIYLSRSRNADDRKCPWVFHAV